MASQSQSAFNQRISMTEPDVSPLCQSLFWEVDQSQTVRSLLVSHKAARFINPCIKTSLVSASWIIAINNPFRFSKFGNCFCEAIVILLSKSKVGEKTVFIFSP